MLKAFLSLLFSLLLTNAHAQVPSVSPPPNDASMEKGLWKAPSGAIWMRCSLGQAWDGNTCTGTPTNVAWWRAVAAAAEVRFDGKKDWRLPTIWELWSLAHCSNGFDTSSSPPDLMPTPTGPVRVAAPCNGSRFNQANFARPTLDQASFPASYTGNYWSSTPNGVKRWMVDFGRAYPDGTYGNAWEGASATAAVRLVRTDDPAPSEWMSALELAGKSASAVRVREQAAAQAEAERRAQAERDRVAAARDEAEYDRRTSLFRKQVKEGDDTTLGIVVEVKGQLIKVQTIDSQCTQRDYKGNCLNWMTTPVEKWMKRSEIRPPR